MVVRREPEECWFLEAWARVAKWDRERSRGHLMGWGLLGRPHYRIGRCSRSRFRLPGRFDTRRFSGERPIYSRWRDIRLSAGYRSEQPSITGDLSSTFQLSPPGGTAVVMSRISRNTFRRLRVRIQIGSHNQPEKAVGKGTGSKGSEKMGSNGWAGRKIGHAEPFVRGNSCRIVS